VSTWDTSTVSKATAPSPLAFSKGLAVRGSAEEGRSGGSARGGRVEPAARLCWFSAGQTVGEGVQMLPSAVRKDAHYVSFNWLRGCMTN
jgi:hypothetical protein